MADLRLIDTEDFLDIVWGEATTWIDLPSKVDKYWIPWHYRYPGEADLNITKRIDDCLRDNESLYFSAGTFSQKGRQFDDFRPPQWLWADLDEIHPSTATKAGIYPTIAWESSPGRYQAMWKLKKAVSPSAFDRVNRALSYFLGADHGGWDRTQVLRLPGTVNFKYPEAPLVKLMWCEPEIEYTAKYVWGIVKEASPMGEGIGRDGDIVLPRKAMPAKVRGMLRKGSSEIVAGERSTGLWSMECSLAEAGWNADEIYNALWGSAWNKWANVGTGEARMRAEIDKAIHHVLRKAVLSESRRAKATVDKISTVLGTEHRPSDVGTDTGAPGREARDDGRSEELGTLVLPWQDYWSFMGDPMGEPRWMIKDIWVAGSQGILGGEPKTSKTTLALGVAMSVASGKCLFGDSDFVVKDPGPVLFIQEENAGWLMQDRMRKMAKTLGILGQGVTRVKTSSGGLGEETYTIEFPTDIPMTMLNNYGFDLGREDHRDALWRECEKLKPRLVVLDPLYMIMAGVNFDKAHELAPYLKWVLNLSNDFKCSVMIVHHFRKAQQGEHTRPGQRLMGNATLHGFVDSALYCEQGVVDDRRRKNTLSTLVHREFRSSEPQRSLEFNFKMDPPGGLGFSVDILAQDVTKTILDLILEQPGVTLRQISVLTGIHRNTILGRCRASDEVEVRRVRRGRSGIQYSLYPTENGNRN